MNYVPFYEILNRFQPFFDDFFWFLLDQQIF